MHHWWGCAKEHVAAIHGTGTSGHFTVQKPLLLTNKSKNVDL